MKDFAQLGWYAPAMKGLLAAPAIGTPPGGAPTDFRRFFRDPDDATTEVTFGRDATFVGVDVSDAGVWRITNLPDVTAVSVPSLTLESNLTVTITVSEMPAALADIEVILELPTAPLGCWPAVGRGGRFGYQSYTFVPAAMGLGTIDVEFDIRKSSLDARNISYSAPVGGVAYFRVWNKKSLLSSQEVSITIG